MVQGKRERSELFWSCPNLSTLRMRNSESSAVALFDKSRAEASLEPRLKAKA